MEEKKTTDADRLNRMLRQTGYGQGQIDAYVAQCEDLEEAVELLRRARKVMVAGTATWRGSEPLEIDAFLERMGDRYG